MPKFCDHVPNHPDVGHKVVCQRSHASGPVKGKIYKIREVYFMPNLDQKSYRFEEIVLPKQGYSDGYLEMSFCSEDFEIINQWPMDNFITHFNSLRANGLSK